MAGFGGPAFYGDRWAAVYDDRHRHVDPGPAVEFLAGLAGDGQVLELAIGTGRIALPLAARRITVEGIDASAAMAGRLRAKPGGDSVPVTIADKHRSELAQGSARCAPSYQVDQPRGDLFWKRSTCSVPSRSIPVSIAIG